MLRFSFRSFHVEISWLGKELTCSCGLIMYLIDWYLLTVPFGGHFIFWEAFEGGREPVIANGPKIYDLNSALYCPNNCGRKYKHKRHLNRHLKYECGVSKQFKCEECDKKFSHKYNLKNHAIIVHKKLI